MIELIRIKIGDKTFELTPEELEELKQDILRLSPEQPVTPYVPAPAPPWPTWPNPIITGPPTTGDPPPCPPHITCGTHQGITVGPVYN